MKSTGFIFLAFVALAGIFLFGLRPEPKSQTTLSPGIHAVGEGRTSTTFGSYGTSPESPDGSRIAFVKFLEEPKNERDGRPAELWVCNADLSNYRKVCDLPMVRPHNGAEVLWIDDSTLAFSTPWGWGSAPREIHVVDADTGQDRFPPLTGITDFGHNTYNGKILFATDSRAKNGGNRPSGIYELDIRSGKIRSILSLDQLSAVESQLPASVRDAGGVVPPSGEWKIFHLMYSPGGERIAFRFDVGKVKLLATMKADGSDIRAFDNQPLHFLWYDDASLVGHENKLRTLQLERYSLLGERIETISQSPGNHLAVSPDKTAFLSENIYGRDPVVLKYIRYKDDQPPRILAEFAPGDLVWKKSFHVNPSFSRDGRRAYFNKPTDGGHCGTFVTQLLD